MTNPVTVEVLRGEAVESRHRGAISIVDAAGKTVFSLGDVEKPIFPRSAIKALQALPLVESGIADRLGLTAQEISLACSSHSGEPIHVETALSMLKKAGKDADCLECGAHWPVSGKAERELAASGEKPSALHNNCSGKHSGFICLSCGLDEDPKGYIASEHRVQREIRAAGEEMTGFTYLDAYAGIDGCSIPTYAVPLKALALGFARFGTGYGLDKKRAEAAQRIREAVAQYPLLVAGTGRFDTDVMNLFGARLFMKTGAEGVYCATIPEKGLGIAVKCDDGEGRAAQVILGAIVQHFLPMSETEHENLAKLAEPVLRNWNGIEVGRLRSVLDFTKTS
ncbi:MAG: hypothetical protein RL543_1220 [Pseudomonadota bacterium]